MLIIKWLGGNALEEVTIYEKWRKKPNRRSAKPTEGRLSA